MALQFVLKGSNAFSLSKDDNNKYPGSLLHSLITWVDSSDGLVVKLDDLPDSMFVSWPAAVTITTEIYRQGYIEAATLSGLWRQYTTADLFNKLQFLIDYLALPGTIIEYLPPAGKVPLMHRGVLGLYQRADVYPLVKDAVQAILSSTAFTDPEFCKPNCGEPWWSQRAAFFYLTTLYDCTRPVAVEAYAVPASAVSTTGKCWDEKGATVWCDAAACIEPLMIACV